MGMLHKLDLSEIETRIQHFFLGYFGVRHLQCLLLFIGLCTAFMMRINMSTAIVSMMDKSSNPDYEEFQWSQKIKSMLLSAFLWLYWLSQVPGGILAHIYGGKIMLFYSMAINGVLCLLSPLSAQIGDYWLLIVVRVLQGLVQGCIYPSMHTLLSKWIPPDELAIWATFSYTGNLVGTIVMMAISGVIVVSFLGWPGIFNVSGLLGLIWSAIWFIFGCSTPAESKLISEEEKELIANALNTTRQEQENAPPLKTPWREIFTSLPFLSLLVAQCASMWTLWTMLTQTPSFIYGVLKKDIESNSILSALPFVMSLIMTYVFSCIEFLLNRRFSVPIKIRRKMFNTIGQWCPIPLMIWLGFLDAESSTTAVVLMTIIAGLASAQFLGIIVNHIDLAANFAGILMGIANGCSHIVGLLAPIYVGFIVNDTTNANEWRIVYCTAAGFFFIGNLLFLIFGRTTTQPWNSPKE